MYWCQSEMYTASLVARRLAPISSTAFPSSMSQPEISHSFKQPHSFLTTTIHNILGRVTDQNPSSIFGTIDSVTFYPNANLFLMNPFGFLFGPNAVVNVGGMVAFTTADYLRLADGARFNAIPNATADALLSAAPVAAFGFLGSNPAAIAIQGGTLQVAHGPEPIYRGWEPGFTAMDPDTDIPISVPAGVTMTGGTLSALGGQVNLASVASPGEVSAVDFMPSSGMTMGSITLSQGSKLDVSADAAGTIRIRGGQLGIIDSTLSADTGNAKGAATAIDINIKGDISINDTRGLPAITARTSGHGNAGLIDITSTNLYATSTSLDLFALIDSHTFGAGRGGDVTLTATDTVHANGGLLLIDSGTAGPGNGGDVTINSALVQFENAGLSTGDFIARSTRHVAGGAGGNLIITADHLQANNSIFDSSSFFGQTAGNITLNVREIMGSGLQIGAVGHSGGGGITLNSDSVLLNDGSVLENDIQSGQGGGVTITARVVELRTGSGIVSTTFGDGQAGNINITATDHFTMAGRNDDSNPTGLFSNSVGASGSGNAGSVIVTTPKLEMSGGARINTITEGSGHGGDVIINTTGDISISGEYPFNLPEPIFGIGTIGPSGIFTTTRGSDLCLGTCGDAGNIAITARSLTLGNGAQIDSSTSNNGHAGNISIQVSDHISLSGTLNDGSPVGIFSQTTGTDPDAGPGGNIALTAGQSVTISDGASISASSTGPGNTGNIQINAGNLFEMTNQLSDDRSRPGERRRHQDHDHPERHGPTHQ